MDSGTAVSEKAMGCAFGRMDPNMKEFGPIIKLMGKEYFTMLMVTLMKVTGLKTGLVATVSTPTKMATPTRGGGSMTSKMVKAEKSGSMVPPTQATIKMGRNMDSDTINGLTDQSIKATGTKARLPAKASTHGQTADHMMAHGKII